MRTRSTRLLTVLAAGLLGLAGCSTAAEPAVVPQANTHVAPAGSTPDATTRIETLPLNGAQRSYRMMIPATAHAGALPLVVVLHGASLPAPRSLPGPASAPSPTGVPPW